MAYFTLHRNFVLRTNKGHSIGFIKDEPVWVPPLCEADAVAIGAIPDEDGNVDVLPPEQVQAPPLTPAELEQKLFEAFDKMTKRNQRGDFTASGLPHCRRLQLMLGFEIGNNERDDAWQKYRQRLLNPDEELKPPLKVDAK